MSWSAAQYSKFEAERNRPVFDLLAQLPADGVKSAADIGCGPGNSTELLLAKYPHSSVIGMDSSDNMIDAARKRLPMVQFSVEDVMTWSAPGPFDVILGNAVLHWVPNHAAVFQALLKKLSPGGCLAIQMPDNLDEPAHRLMRRIASESPWSEKIGNVAAELPPRHDASWYFRELRDRVTSLDIWRTTYHHLLAGGASAVSEWFKGTGLRPFLDPLNDAERESFLARYEDGVASSYDIYPDGTVLLPFPRLFIVATR